MDRFLKRKREEEGEEDEDVIDLTTDAIEEEKEKEPLIISLGQNKGDFECPRITVAAKTFQKTTSCIDIVSFDVGTTHLAVARLRYDRQRFRCCIVEAALIDIYNPWQSLRPDKQFRSSEKSRKQRKPAHVEPFSGAEWPAIPAKENEEEKQQELYRFHAEMLEKKRIKRAEETNEALQWTHDVEMLSLALHWVPWLHDHQIDRVLVEQQQYDNTKMRCISYCLLDMFQTRRLVALSLCPAPLVPSISKEATLELFPSTLKLSQWVINVLLQSWTVLPDPTLLYSAPKEEEKEEDEEEDDDGDGEEEKGVTVRTLEEVEEARKQRAKKNRNNTMLHDDLVDHATHGTKKQSASRVLTYFFTPRSPTPDRKPDRQHPFHNWLTVQRAEKHNVCDAVLQAIAFIIKNEQQPQMVRQRKKRTKAPSKTKTSTLSRSALSLSTPAASLPSLMPPPPVPMPNRAK